MLIGKIRDSISKSSTKALRKDGYLIANIYGFNKNNIHCVFKENEFIKYVRSKDTLAFDVKIENDIFSVVVQEYQKHPVTYKFLHVDLMFAQKDVIAKYKVPIKTYGTPIGLKNKGVLIYSRKRLAVECDIVDIPKEYNLNVSSLDIGDNILVRDLEQYKNVKILEKSDTPVVGVIKTKG